MEGGVTGGGKGCDLRFGVDLRDERKAESRFESPPLGVDEELEFRVGEGERSSKGTLLMADSGRPSGWSWLFWARSWAISSS